MGRKLPAGMRQAERLPEPMFTPTTKAEEGHDLPLNDADAAALVGDERYEELRDLTLAIYSFGAELAAKHGLILADTKLEFGEVDGRLVVIDEMMTPDSSRYWSSDDHQVGTSPPSFDKQYVRDHYLSIGWDKQPPVPHMPASVIEGTRARYVEAYEQVSGRSFDTWYGDDE
jgi:phosphoribosylaminoimidazole-succinocarboxamide synthase